MKFIQKIFSKDYRNLTLSIIILLLISTCFFIYSKYKNEKLNHKRDIFIHENNISALKDSLETYYNEQLKQNISEKTTFLIDDISELKKYNETLYNEMKNIKNSINIIKSKVSVDVGSGEVDNDLVNIDTNTYGLRWDFTTLEKGLYQKLSGISKFKLINNSIFAEKTVLDTNIFEIGLSYGFVDMGDKYKVWATSPSNKVKFTELDGAMYIDKELPISNKRNYIAFGPSIGGGYNTDLSGENGRLGWNVGFNLTYNIFNKNSTKKSINKRYKKIK